MITFLKIFASFLLLFDGIGAIYGGWNLITHPDGSSMRMSLEYLKYSPFDDYLVPGIILFIANGIFSFFVIAAIVFKLRNYSWFIITQGVVLSGWIVIQVILVREINSLHLIYGATGILLIICGLLLNSRVTTIQFGNSRVVDQTHLDN